MDNSQFSIVDASKNAYLFIGREWAYLVKVGTPAVILQIALSLFVQYARPDASVIEGYLWALPATMMFAWYAFLQTRLLLLGERIDKLPQDKTYQRDRRQAMRVAVLTALVFNMAMSAAIGLLLLTNMLMRAAATSTSAGGGSGVALMIVTLMIMALIIWGLRFGVLPILGAVHYPFRPFLKLVDGRMFSIRLVGLGMLSLLPVMLVSQILMMMVVGNAADPNFKTTLSAAQETTLTVLGSFISFAITVILNAALVFALKQILGKSKEVIA